MYKKMIITMFILLGLLLICSPLLKGGIIAYLSKSQSESALTMEQLKRNNEKEAEFEFDSIEPPELVDAIKAGLDHDQSGYRADND